jgi:hypothetical protein
MRRVTSFFALVLFVGSHLAAQSPASPDLWAGTRHLVLSKSIFRDGPAPKERTFVIETLDGGIKATVTGTEADGSSVNLSYAARFDGKYYATSGSGAGDSVSFRRVSARRLESTHKTGANVDAMGTFALSKDGSVVTLTFKGPGGEPGNVLVFAK